MRVIGLGGYYERLERSHLEEDRMHDEHVD